MRPPDYFKILGLQFGASDEEIKTAYRKLSKKFHPDVNEGDPFFAEKFKELQEAYEILTDPKQKEEYIKKFTQGDQYRAYDERAGHKQENKKAKTSSSGAKIGAVIFGLVLIAVAAMKFFTTVEKTNAVKSTFNSILSPSLDTANKKADSNYLAPDTTILTTPIRDTPRIEPYLPRTIIISKQEQWVFIKNNDVDGRLEITPKFTISNAREIPCHAVAYFYDNTGVALKAATDNEYATTEGTLSGRVDFTPRYDTSEYNLSYSDFMIKLPYSELNLYSGTYNLEFKVVLFNDGWDILTSSEMYSLPFTKY